MRKLHSIALVLILSACQLFAQGRGVTVSGYVRDKSSGEAVIGATVYTSDKSAGTSSNNFGFYSLTLPKGSHRIICSTMGYLDLELEAENLPWGNHGCGFVPQDGECS